MSTAELEPRSTLPPQDHTQLDTLLAQLQEETMTAVLEVPSGHRIALPAEIYTVLLDITKAMAEGRAITIAPHEQVLSTQQAADLLGVSRPTLVAILERGEIAYTQPGRHRRVRLTDVLDYQQRQRHTRRRVLHALTREADDLGITDTPAPPRRIRD